MIVSINNQAAGKVMIYEVGTDPNCMQKQLVLSQLKAVQLLKI